VTVFGPAGSPAELWRTGSAAIVRASASRSLCSPCQGGRGSESAAVQGARLASLAREEEDEDEDEELELFVTGSSGSESVADDRRELSPRREKGGGSLWGAGT
jgi:hypothetical protein